MGEFKVKIGEGLRRQRMLLGYSQEYVANTLGMSQNSYSKIERNITDVSLNRVYEIADILEISVYKLLPRPDTLILLICGQCWNGCEDSGSSF